MSATVSTRIKVTFTVLNGFVPVKAVQRYVYVYTQDTLTQALADIAANQAIKRLIDGGHYSTKATYEFNGAEILDTDYNIKDLPADCLVIVMAVVKGGK